VGVIVATDPLNHTSLAPRGFPWPSLSQFIPKDALPLMIGEEEGRKVPVVHAGEAVIAQLFGSVDSLRALQRRIDGRVAPCSFAIAGSEAFLRTSTEIRDMSANNVVGILPGSDASLSSETVIVGAHYDHIGVMKQHAPGARYIFNGADDNASGACALLEVAAALGGLPSPPRRTILCIAFSGEEKGLFGSEFYARHPLFPLENTVAMLNMDMVGMNGEDSLFLIGSEGSPDIARIAREEDARVGLTLVDQKMTMGGSDHMSFMKRNIPDLFFHSGLESVYHTVNDRPELINARKVARTASLVFLTAYHIAADSVRYRYLPVNSPMF
jgi:Zn-dependent M28 family amino/carboxypeptidase